MQKIGEQVNHKLDSDLVFQNGLPYDGTNIPATLKKFQKHIKIIIEQLFTLLINKEIKDFVDVLSEEVKNLAARLGKTGTLDKKVEK